MTDIDDLSILYLKNLQFFKKNYVDILYKLSIVKENQLYDLIVDERGFFNIESIKTKQTLLQENPLLLAKEQVANALKEQPNPEKIIFIGSLLGFGIEEMLARTNPQVILIIEPNIEIFKLSCFLVDYETLCKNKVAIFSIADDEFSLENRVLEFIYTLHQKNEHLSFLTSITQYSKILTKVEKTYTQNVFLTPEAIQTKKTTLKKTFNFNAAYMKAKDKQNKGEIRKALETFHEIIFHECIVENSETEKKELVLSAYLALGIISYNTYRNNANAYMYFGKCIYTKGAKKDLFEDAFYNYALISQTASKLHGKTLTILKEYFQTPSQNVSLISLYAEFLYGTIQIQKAHEFLEPYKELLIKEHKIVALLEPVLPVYHSQEAIDSARERLADEIEELIKLDIRIPEQKLSVYQTFLLAYHNRNNKNILSRLSDFYRQASPEISHVAKHCKNYRFSGKKIKIGFISALLIPNHPVLKFAKNIIDSFEKNSLYDVKIYTLSKETTKVFHKNVHLLGGSLQEMRKTITNDELDILLYTDIGMNPVIYLLAHARLAHIQGLFGGHPVTSGISTIDYFFSNKNLEAQNAQEYYTEELLLFENLVGHYDKPKIPETFLTKEELGLDCTKHNYIIPSKLQKIHPELDGLLNDILKKDNKAVFIFFKDATENMWDSAVKERLIKLLHEEHIKFMPWAKSDAFLSYMHHADAVLEPVNFGFGTTAIEAFSVGTPIVTYPKELMYSRVTYWYYKQMGIDDFYAKSAAEYVNLAIKLASDANYKESIKSKILERNSVLYENSGAYEELDDFFREKFDINL
ncbi:MAG: hypothetical protein WC272_10595 [Sulfurimonas sp.]|jgi:predicted O-linked N-acetylglucosamine transferase (SPINDLY family)